MLSCAPPMYDELWTAAKAMYKLEPAVARGLKSHVGHLQLTGLKSLAPEAAEELVGCKGVIHLDGIDALDNAVALILAKHRGAPETGFVIGPDALRDLDDKAKAAIIRNSQIRQGNWFVRPTSP